MKNNDLIKFSKEYYKSLSKQNFKKDLISCSNQRTRNFLPLYAAINQSYGFITSTKILKEVIDYLEMLKDQKKKNEVFNKFINSYKNWKNLSNKTEELDKQTSKEIFKVFNRFKLSTYSLNKEFGINLKIASQIKNKKQISLSTVKKMQLLRQIKNKYENRNL